MQHHTHTALFTTISGVVGGVGKAISAKPLLLAITLRFQDNVLLIILLYLDCPHISASFISGNISIDFLNG